LESLSVELEQAEVVLPQGVPADVVTIKSKVVLRNLTTSKEMTCVFVFQRDANIDEGAVLTLTP